MPIVASRGETVSRSLRRRVHRNENIHLPTAICTLPQSTTEKRWLYWTLTFLHFRTRLFPTIPWVHFDVPNRRCKNYISDRRATSGNSYRFCEKYGQKTISAQSHVALTRVSCAGSLEQTGWPRVMHWPVVIRGAPWCTVHRATRCTLVDHSPGAPITSADHCN